MSTGAPAQGAATCFCRDCLGDLDVKAILAQQDYWADYFDLVATKVAEKDLVDPTVMKEALERLEKDSPFKK